MDPPSLSKSDDDRTSRHEVLKSLSSRPGAPPRAEALASPTPPPTPPELRNLLPNFDKNGRMVPPGTRYAIANGDICLPPDLVHRVMHEKRPPP